MENTTYKIRSFEDINLLENRKRTIVTLFSGGLDSSYLLAMLKKMSFKRVVALSVDVGEDVNKLQIEKTARTLGAELKFIDAKNDFVSESVLPAIKAQSKYLGIFPISSSLSRPIIAKCAVSLAKELGADVILHTANQSQNSLRRLNGAIEAHGFKGFYGSPYEYSAVSRDEKAKTLASYGLSYYLGRKLSGDANLWCREYESGPLDNPEHFELDESAYKWSVKPPADYSDKIKITFNNGIPVALDGENYQPITLIEVLNKRAGKAGIGRFVGLEHLNGQEKVLELREMPAACLLLDAYRHIETATLPSPLITIKQHMEQVWVQEAVEGRWYSELKHAASSFINRAAEKVSGSVTYRLGHQSFFPCSIIANDPLYITDRDAWEILKAKQEYGRTIFNEDQEPLKELA